MIISPNAEKALTRDYREMALGLKAYTVFAEDQSLIPSTYIEQLTTVYNFSPRGIQFLWALRAPTLIPIHRHIRITINFKKNFE